MTAEKRPARKSIRCGLAMALAIAMMISLTAWAAGSLQQRGCAVCGARSHL